MVMWTGHMDSGDSISFYDILYGSLPFCLLDFQALVMLSFVLRGGEDSCI